MTTKMTTNLQLGHKILAMKLMKNFTLVFLQIALPGETISCNSLNKSAFSFLTPFCFFSEGHLVGTIFLLLLLLFLRQFLRSILQFATLFDIKFSYIDKRLIKGQ